MSEDNGAEPMNVAHVHMTPNVAAGSEMSLRFSLEGLQASLARSSLICAEPVETADWPGLDTVVSDATLFSTEPASPLRVKAIVRHIESIIDDLNADVVHIRLGLRVEVLDRLARRLPVVYSAHLPICPNGARYRYSDEAVCIAPIGLSCVTQGFRSHGCGHLVDGTAVSLPAFSRAALKTRRLLGALHSCRTIIASSRWQAQRLATDGVPAERIEVLHPPVIPCVPTPTDGDPIVAFAGRLVSFKGAAHLLRACSEIDMPHRIWIIGRGPQRVELEGLAHDLRISHRLQFHGAVSPEEARRLLGCASVVVVPSLWPETFNQVGAQVAVSGIPVVGYDVGGMRDWAEQYPSVSLVSPGDRKAVVTAIEHALQKPTPTNGSPNHFSVERHVKALATIYEKALTARP